MTIANKTEFDTIVDALSVNRERADEKWNRSGYTLYPFVNNQNLGVAILTEEVGEVARAVLEGDQENLVQELLDVMQVAACWLENLEHFHGTVTDAYFS